MSSEKILWSSVLIKVPSEFISVNNKGKILIKPPLTKKNNISKSNGKPSIKIITDNNIDKVEILEQGQLKSASQETKIKPINSRKKTDTKLINQIIDNSHNESRENKLMGNEDINVSKKPSNEEMELKMQKLRDMKKKK